MARLPKVKLRAIPVFPSIVQATSPVLLVTNGVTYVFSFDTNALIAALLPIFSPADTSTLQEITSGTTAIIDQTARVVRVNKLVGGAITLTVPDSSLKTCDVLISDWKGDAGTNNITVNLSGVDKFPGNLTSW